jgi:hypothetical protein
VCGQEASRCQIWETGMIIYLTKEMGHSKATEMSFFFSGWSIHPLSLTLGGYLLRKLRRAESHTGGLLRYGAAIRPLEPKFRCFTDLNPQRKRHSAMAHWAVCVAPGSLTLRQTPSDASPALVCNPKDRNSW